MCTIDFSPLSKATGIPDAGRPLTRLTTTLYGRAVGWGVRPAVEQIATADAEYKTQAFGGWQWEGPEKQRGPGDCLARASFVEPNAYLQAGSPSPAVVTSALLVLTAISQVLPVTCVCVTVADQ